MANGYWPCDVEDHTTSGQHKNPNGAAQARSFWCRCSAACATRRLGAEKRNGAVVQHGRCERHDTASGASRRGSHFANYAIAVLFYSVLCGPSIRRPRVVARRGASQKSCIEFAHLTNCLLGGKGIPSRRVHNRQDFTAGPSCQASDQCSDGVYTNRGSTYKRRRSSKGKCNGTENRSGRISCTMQSPKSTCETSVCKLWKPFRNRLS